MKLKSRLDFKSIRFRLWVNFLAVSIGILVIVWFLQSFLLNRYYETMKIDQVNDVSTLITHTYINNADNLTREIASLSMESDLYVMMESQGTLLLFTPEQDTVMPVYKYRSELPKLRRLISESDKNVVSYKFSVSYEQYETLAFCKLIPNSDDTPTFLYIFAPLYPVQSTVTILKEQLLNVTIIALIIAFLFALVLSTRISKPLAAITKDAKKMGEGDYTVTFDDRTPYSEINRLSRTLNKAVVEMGRADNIQKDLIANVSHDLKTPLTLIRSYAEMIRDLSGDNPKKREEHLSVILKETDRMTKLVTDMSELSKMQNRKIELNLSDFDLSEAVAEILSTYRILEENEGYHFIFNAPKKTFVTADEARIKQVISNLLGNAVKYCGNNREITVNILKKGHFYRVEVIDHGKGIPEDFLPHIWDRYYRVSDNYGRSDSGSGLGLSIVKQILTLHNAEFGVISKVNEGSTFYFELEAHR